MNILRRHRKVLNIGGGGGGRGARFRILEGGGGGGKWPNLTLAAKLIEAPARPQSVPNSYISHTEN